jgi:hypothetical protein
MHPNLQHPMHLSPVMLHDVTHNWARTFATMRRTYLWGGGLGLGKPTGHRGLLRQRCAYMCVCVELGTILKHQASSSSLLQSLLKPSRVRSFCFMCLVALAARCAVQIDCIFVVMRCPKAHGHSVRCELLAIVVPALINNAGLPIVSPALLINA